MTDISRERQRSTTIENKEALRLLELLPYVFLDEGQAFEELFLLYEDFLAGQVLAFIYRKNYPKEMEHEVWSIVNYVFVTIWQRGKRRFFQPVAGEEPLIVAQKFEAWLRRFAQFTCMGEARKCLEHQKHTLSLETIEYALENPDESLDDVIDWLDQQDFLQKLLKELSTREQKILKYYMQGMKQAEIAQTLSMTTLAVKAAFSRLKQKCRLIGIRAQQQKGEA